MTPYALGVELGTTYSAAVVARGSEAAVCSLGDTAAQIASIVFLGEDGEILIGEAAERRAAGEPTRAAREFTRRLGDPVPIIVGGTPYGAEALMAHLLRAIVEQVSAHEGAEPDVVVLTHPADYTDYKRGLLHETARLAGLDLSRVRFVSEPQAAATADADQERVEPATVDPQAMFANATGAALLGAAAITGETGNQITRTAGLAATGAAAGGGATLAAGAIIGDTTAAGAVAGGTAATGGAAAVGVGPAGVSMVAGPVGAPVGVGPVGAPVGVGPLGAPVAGVGPQGEVLTDVRTVQRTARRAARTTNKARLAIGIGAVAGAAVVAGIVVVSAGGDDQAATAPTTVAAPVVSDSVAPTEATPPPTAGVDDQAAPVVSDSVATTVSAPPSTALPSAAGRGLAGLVTVIAGTGRDDGNGRPGPAEAASLGNAAHFAVAPNGDIFVVNHENELLLVSGGQTRVIYEADSPGGESGFGGVAVGPDGDAYVTMGTGVKRIARDGTNQLVVDSRALGLRGGFGPITFDNLGSLYFSEASGHRVLRWAADGEMSIVAGTGVQGRIGSAPDGDGGPATASALTGVNAMAVDSAGNLLIVESGRPVVRRIAADGTISTLVGGGQTLIRESLGNYAPDGTLAGDLQFSSLTGVAVDAAGRVYVSEGADHAIVRFGADGAMELLAADQSHALADFGIPANEFRAFIVTGLTFDSSGNLLFEQSNRILSIADASND